MAAHSIRFVVGSFWYLLLPGALVGTSEHEMLDAINTPNLNAENEKEREVAEADKLLKMGGQLIKDHGKVTQIMLMLKNKKPRAPGFSDDDVESIDFTAYPHLKSLLISSSFSHPITDRTIAHLMKMPSSLMSLDIEGAKFSDAGLGKLLKKQRFLRSIIFTCSKAPITDRTLREMAALEDLRDLTLRETEITDAGVKEISKMELQTLVLQGSKITDAGLKEISKIEPLFLLDLSNSEITDAGLQHVKKMKGLTGLALVGTKITDAGLLELAPLTNLRRLRVSGVKITEDGKHALIRLLPNLQINFK